MSNKTTFGILFIGFGIIWLLNNFGIINSPSFGNWISILLVASGTWKLVSSQFKSIMSSTILIVLGLVSGLLQLDIIQWSDINKALLPIVVILCGVALLSRNIKTS